MTLFWLECIVNNMGDVVDIRARFSREDRERRMRQALSARRLIHCLACPMHCARCGSSLDGDPARTIAPELPLRLCEACGDDYDTFLAAKSGRDESRAEWQNDDWFRTWSSWLEYQGSLVRLAGSSEFQKILAQDEFPFE